MVIIAESLAGEIGGYIKNLINKDAAILDDKGLILSSPDIAKVGTLEKIPLEFSELTSSKIIKIEGEAKTLIPLKHQNKNVAFLMVDGEPSEVGSYSSLIKSFTELLIQQHYDSNKPVLDSTDQFLTKVLTNFNQSELKSYEAEAGLLGYDLSRKRLAIVIHLKGFWDNCLLDLDQPSFERDQVIKNWKRNLEQSFNSFFTKNADLMIGYLGNDKFVIFKAIEEGEEESVKKLLKKSYKSIFEPLKSRRIENVTVGFGNAYQGVDGLLNSKREAELTLELGQRIWGDNQSYYFGELGLLSILGEGDRDKKTTFSNQILNRLRNDELSKTLECFFDNNLNLTDTAESMGIHRNTVIYRLNQISKTLNADPRVFEQAMSIKIALLIRSLFGEN